jgi:predicted nucleotidyltransferase component of viral defense system
MLSTEKHRMLMYKILKEIFESELWKNIAFKWWTASYFLHSLDRFSTDLDFDLLENEELLDEKLINILNKYWEIKKWNKLILSYWENQTNIKIDINRNIWKSNKYEIVDFFGTSIKVQEKSTIFANKLVALVERFTNRDIYDVYFFFQNLFDINEEIILERTWKNKKELFISIKEKLNELPDNYKILDWLWELLTEKQKSFVKNKLVKELIWLLEMKINFW